MADLDPKGATVPRKRRNSLQFTRLRPSATVKYKKYEEDEVEADVYKVMYAGRHDALIALVICFPDMSVSFFASVAWLSNCQHIILYIWLFNKCSGDRGVAVHSASACRVRFPFEGQRAAFARIFER